MFAFRHSRTPCCVMTSPKEVEIKLELTPTSLSQVKRIPFIRRLRAAPKQTTEVSVYFDTPKRKLHKKGLLLRVRRIGDRYIQTIKASAHSHLFDRRDWQPKPRPRCTAALI